MTKIRKTYEEEAEKLSRAIDIAIESYKARPPYQWNNHHIEIVTSHLIQDRYHVLNPEPKFKSLASLKYAIETVFTYFQEGTGPTVEYFWNRINESGLDYERVNKLEKILIRGKIRGRIEYDYVTDILVVAQQTNMVTKDEAIRLSEFLNNFEKKKYK